MTNQPHDQFAKQYLEGLLAPLGEVGVWSPNPYFLGVAPKTALIAVNRLLETPETL